MGAIITLVIFVLTAVAGPFIAFFTSKYIEQGRRERAYKRITSDPLVCVGARILRLESYSRDRLVMGACVISLIEVGYMQIRSVDDDGVFNGEIVSLTGREFEQLVPVFRDRDVAGG